MHANNGVDTGTLKNEIWMHQIVYVSQNPPESSMRGKFLHMPPRTSLEINTVILLFAINFLEQRKMFLIGKKQQYSWLFIMFYHVKEMFVSSQAVLPRALGHKMFSSHHIQPVTNDFRNHISQCDLHLSDDGRLMDFVRFPYT